MDTLELCIHEVAPGACLTCQEPLERFSHARPAGAVVRARYRGQCLVCDATVFPGDLLRWADDSWVHKRCYD